MDAPISSPASTVVHVLIIAHPDDETMFFLPWIIHMREHKPSAVLWLLCLTTGNYDGLGKIREKELYRVAKDILGLSRVLILDEPAIMPDHPVERWNVALVADRIHTVLSAALLSVYGSPSSSSSSPIEALHLVTFDAGGVSGHVNHRDTFRAVQRFYSQQQQQPDPSSSTAATRKNRLARTVTAWSLETIHNPLIKYLPLWEWCLLIWYTWMGCQWPTTTTTTTAKDKTVDDAGGTVRTFRLLRPSLNWRAMSTHRSQFVWYRRLFVVFSRYTYCNRLRRMTMAITEVPDNDPTRRRRRAMRTH